MEMTEFIRGGFGVPLDYFRETGELMIDIPSRPRPSLDELQAKVSWPRFHIKKIERDTSPTEAVTLHLGTVLRLNDERIGGPEYERRLAQKLDLCLGYQQAVWLEENKNAFPALMEQLGNFYIDFPGLVVVLTDGLRSFPCFRGNGERWDIYWHWGVDGFDRRGRVAVRGVSPVRGSPPKTLLGA